MPGATWAIGSFLGGEISAFAQGRFDKPDYRFSMTSCLNGFPVEIGAWTRRPGSAYGGHTKGGVPGRVIGFDFDASSPITLEFTDGTLRFRNSAALITSNDAQVVLAVSAANPAVVQTTTATNWVTGNTLLFGNLGAIAPLLQNRQFLATKIDATHFSLSDPLTGASINGATLGAVSASATVSRVHELATNYVAGAWSSVRAVQAETTDILLNGNVAPQTLTVVSPPGPGVNPAFSIAQTVFNDGPYLDPFTNGVLANPNQVTGVIQITLSFPPYVATTSYTNGSFVTSAAINYVSLIDQNVGNTPASSPAAWKATTASAAINNGAGFLGTDVGRLVRFLSEPLPWLVTTAYVINNVVSYNPSGAPGGATYWQCIANTTGIVPGTDITHWQLMPSTAAQWTWGKITGLLNIIAGNVAGVAQIGNMTFSGGLAASFDGALSKVAAAASQGDANLANLISGNPTTIFDGYVGQNYSGTGPTAFAIGSVTVIPSTDKGLASFAFVTDHTPTDLFGHRLPVSFFLGGGVALYASNTAPLNAKNGILLGTSTLPQFAVTGATVGGVYGEIYSPITIVSSDQITTWKYVWVVISPNVTLTTNSNVDVALNTYSAQVECIAPGTSAAASAGVNVELIGPALLYGTAIQTWRLGVYSNTTGWPTCGIYNDGRLFLGGAVGNRFDASVSNGIVGGTVNMAPTDQFGVVAPSAAIAYVFNSNGVNQIEWMKPDLQGVLMGTKAGEWLVQAPTAGSIAPTNITARNVTHHGSANIQPVSTEHTTAFVQRYARKLLEYFPDVYSGKFTAPNLADKTNRTRAGIAELAYTSAVTPIIWGRDALGALFGVTYKRDTLSTSTGPTFYAWHGHTLGSGRTVESICAGPSTGGDLDALTMVTNDPSTGIRHVELLTDTQDEQSPLADAWFLDDAVVPTSMVKSPTGVTLNGLWHLNGKTVQVFAGGLDCGDPGEGKSFSDFLVTNGSLIVPYGDGISAGAGRGKFTAAFLATNPQIVVGFTFTSEGQTTRPISMPDSGARNGPAFAKLSRGHRFGMKLVNTQGLSVGGDLTQPMYPCAFKKGDGVTNLDPLTTFSGIQQDALRDDYGYEGGKLAWRITRPWPANVVAVGNNLMTQDQ